MHCFRPRLALASLLIAFLGPAAHAQDAAADAKSRGIDVMAIEAEIKKLQQQIATIDEQLEKVRGRLTRDKQYRAQRVYIENARAAQKDALKQSKPLIAARGRAEAARSAYDVAVEKAYKRDEEVVEMRRRREQLSAELSDVALDLRVARTVVDHYRREASQSNSPAVREKRAAYDAARKAREQVHTKDEQLAAAKEALAAARQSYDEAVKALPEKQAYEQARKAYEQAVEALPEKKAVAEAQTDVKIAEAGSVALLAAQREEKAAYDALNKAIREEMRTNPRAAEAQAKHKKLDEKYRANRGELRKINRALRNKEREIQRGDNPDVAAARKAYEQARAAVAAAQEAALEPPRQAEREARQAAEQRLGELFSSDWQAKELMAERKELAGRLSDLQKQLKRKTPRKAR